MNILITGIHGFVGSNLVKALMNAHTLYGLDLVTPQKEGVMKTYDWEALKQDQLPLVDAVIHLAGKAHDTQNTTEAQAYFDINTGLTQTIYDYFLASSAKKFIFFSSVKAVADTVDGAVLTEEVAPKPKGPYGESKLAAEQYILDRYQNLASNFRSPVSVLPAPEKKTYILRPAMIHGPGNKGNLNLLYALVLKGIPWPLGAFHNRRSFCSVGNVAYVVAQLLEQAISPGTYHLADDEALSTNELIALMGESLGRKVHIWKLSQPVMHRLAQLGGALHLPLNPERLHKLTENYVVSNAKIKQALGISQLPVSTCEGLKETVKGFG